MPGIAVTQPSYPDNGQTGSAYPTAIDAITQVMARIATAFNPHAVPAAAAAPVLSSSAGGALGARTYYAKITLVTPAGEVAPSAGSNLALLASTLLNVASPTFALGVTGWNVYVGTSSGTETKQNSSPIAIGTAWVEPTGGLISGAALPAGLSPMAVIVDAGAVFNNNVLTEKAAQSLTFTAPTTNPRIDRIVLDPTTGIASSVAGTEAASPSPPAVPAGKQPVAKVALSVGQTSISNSNITDERVAITPASAAANNPYTVLNIIAPRADGDWRGIYRGGWRPAFFNQQWGGAQWGNGPDGSLTDFATGYVDANTFSSIGPNAANTWASTGFKVSEAITLAAVWVKIYKLGDPTNNLEMRILSDDGTGTKPTGSTPITNGTATAQSGKLHSANTNGEWVRFVFPTPPSLSANTTYHIACKSSGAVDASNYWQWMVDSSKSYPHGNMSTGDGTPTWTAASTHCYNFLIEPTGASKFLQSSGQFDGKLVFAEGSPLDQSRGLCQPLRNFFDGREFTYRDVFTALTKDKTVADFLYGFDHDRVVLRCNATTGYMQVDVYESDGTKHTVTGTTDCSSGTKDIAIYVRAKGDGSDAVKLYVNGASEGTPVSSTTITFSPEFRDLGTAWIGGGFPIAPTWTKNTAMGSLPSADGWTYGGTATESSAFAVSGGKLYQNKNGFSSQHGHYYRTTTLSNTNGWAVAWKVKISSSDNTIGGEPCDIKIQDGAKVVTIVMHDYFVRVLDLASAVNVQVNLADREHTFVAVGKGSDFFLFIDGRLAIDGSAQMTSASATNQVLFGDNDPGAGRDADAVWDYVKDYNTAWLPPQFTAGSLSEAAFFSGDRTSILSSLYNGGTLKSVREYCGVAREYIERTAERSMQKGITDTPTTTSTSPVVLTDMERFEIGEEFDCQLDMTGVNTTSIWYTYLYLDGRQIGVFHRENTDSNHNHTSNSVKSERSYAGLHKIECRWATGGGTNSGLTTNRTLGVEVRQ